MTDEKSLVSTEPGALQAFTPEQIDALLQMDLSRLSMQQRNLYLWHFASRQGLDPTTQPFNLLVLNGRLVLYATRTATDQLRKLHGVSVEIIERGPLKIGDEVRGDVYVVKARATDKNGRVDESIGALSLQGISGEALANQLMKCETKAKRRVTLSICGLGMMDEIETQSLQNVTYPATVEGPRRIEPGSSPTPPVEAQLVEPQQELAPAARKYPPSAPPIKIPKA